MTASTTDINAPANNTRLRLTAANKEFSFGIFDSIWQANPLLMRDKCPMCWRNQASVFANYRIRRERDDHLIVCNKIAAHPTQRSRNRGRCDPVPKLR